MRPVRLLQLGVGGVGGYLVDLVASQRERLRDSYGFDIRYLGLARRNRIYLGDTLTLPPDEAWIAGAPADLLEAAEECPEARVVLVDVTAAENADLFLRTLGRGVSVVTANKLPLVGPFQEFWAMHSAAWKTGARLAYECTVGASLPVVGPLRSLARVGDEVSHVRGALSGTLGHLATALDAGKPMSEAVRAAREAGITEPDPREDLGGMDVARKALIMARTLGRTLEMSDVQVENLVPASLADVGVEEFLAGLGVIDEGLAARARQASVRGATLRYLADLTPETVKVGFTECPRESSWGQLSGSDNRIEVATRRYSPTPLVIQGTGAGIRCTAEGVLEDILRVAA